MGVGAGGRRQHPEIPAHGDACLLNLFWAPHWWPGRGPRPGQPASLSPASLQGELAPLVSLGAKRWGGVGTCRETGLTLWVELGSTGRQTQELDVGGSSKDSQPSTQREPVSRPS